MKTATAVSLSAVLLFGLTACAADSDTASRGDDSANASNPVANDENEVAGSDCADAFREADADNDGMVRPSELVPAYDACASHDEWVETSGEFSIFLAGPPGSGEPLPLAEVPAVRCPFAVEVGNPEADSRVCASLPQ